MPWRCSGCRAVNDPIVDTCEQCGRARIPPRRCPADGATLRADGYCEAGDGWPITQRNCPDVCPACRRPLRWDGDCEGCRPAGWKPGHLYDFIDWKPDDPFSGHWRVTERGPQAITGPTPAQRATIHALFARYPSERDP